MTASQEDLALVQHVITSVRQLSYANLKPDLTFTKLSYNFLTTIEYSDKDIVGKSIADVLIEFVGVEDELKDIVNGKLPSYTLPHVNRLQADGTLKYLTFTVVPLNTQKPAVGLILIVEDTTSSGTMEQRLTQQRNEVSLLKDSLQKQTLELELRNRELDAFSYSVAHDLKNPLSSVMGFIGLLETSLDDATASQKQWIEKSSDNIMRMGATIDGLLLLSKLRTAEQVLEPVEVDKIIQLVLTSLKPQLESVKVQVEIGKDIPSAMGHQPWLEAVFTNLIDNASKYMGKDNPAPSIKIRGKQTGDRVRYEVEDNGLGIPGEAQSQLFEMFSRFHVDHARGFGIGLSIVYRIIQKLDGTIGVESNLGEGSTFWFELDAVKKEKRELK